MSRVSAAGLARRLPSPVRAAIKAAVARADRASGGRLVAAGRTTGRSRPAGGGDGATFPWIADGFDPWTPLPGSPSGPVPTAARTCNICRWQGAAFDGPDHCEAATCPRCGAIGRDRFLFWALQHTVDPAAGTEPGRRRLRVLETSPRLGGSYRRAMAGWFDYLCSDFDERAHAGMIRIDLQQIELPGDSLDVVATPHVLEHVPNTDVALAELFRVIRPGGTLLLQVPLLQGATAPPVEPEFHGDRTPVFWRFGPELTDRLTATGFDVRLLAPQALLDAAAAEPGAARPWPQPVSPEFDAEALVAALAHRPELVAIADPGQTERYDFDPAYMYLTWSARKPG